MIEARQAFQKSFEVLVVIQGTEQPRHYFPIERRNLGFGEPFRNLMYAVQRHPVKSKEGVTPRRLEESGK